MHNVKKYFGDVAALLCDMEWSKRIGHCCNKSEAGLVDCSGGGVGGVPTGPIKHEPSPERDQSTKLVW